MASSLGTVELKNGKHKFSKRYFDIALRKPNDNTLAQTEWASSQDNRIIVSADKYNEVINPFEAKALDAYFTKKWKKVFENVENGF